MPKKKRQQARHKVVPKRKAAAASAPKQKTTARKKKLPPPPTTARSLGDYSRDERLAEKKANCPVCALPESVRDQLAVAKRAGRTGGAGYVPRPLVLKWLNEELGYKITDAQLSTHVSGRHDQR